MLDEPPMILAELSVNELAPPEIPALRLPARPGSNATTAAPPSAKPLPLRAAADALGGGGAASGDDAAVDDKLTPRILEALAVLDAEAEKLSALPSPRAFSTDDDEEPDWLKEASEKATAVSKGSHGGGGSSSSSASSSSSSVLTTPRLLDDDDAEGSRRSRLTSLRPLPPRPPLPPASAVTPTACRPSLRPSARALCVLESNATTCARRRRRRRRRWRRWRTSSS